MMYKLIRFIVLATRLDKNEIAFLVNDLRQLGVITIGAAIAGLLLNQIFLAFPLLFAGCSLWYASVWIGRWSKRR